MKKILSVLLSISLIFAFVAVIAGATDGDYQTYCISYDIQDEGILIEPIDGYYTIVNPGDSFKFTVEVERDEEGEPLYSDALAIVQVNGKTIEADNYGIYTIENIKEDVTISIFFSFDTQTTNMFTSIMLLARNFFKMIYEIFANLFK